MKKQFSKKENNYCNENKEFSFTSCVYDFIKKKVGCSVKLSEKQDYYSKCSKKSQLLDIKVWSKAPTALLCSSHSFRNVTFIKMYR